MPFPALTRRAWCGLTAGGAWLAAAGIRIRQAQAQEAQAQGAQAQSAQAQGTQPQGAQAAGPQPAGSDLPPGYTVPAPIVERGRAPRMRARLISGSVGVTRIYAVTFGRGDEVLSGLTEWAQHEKLAAAHLTATGGFHQARLGWFDRDRRAYRDIRVDEQAECASLTGDISLVGTRATVRAHAVLSMPDGSTRGGRLLRAEAWPALEVFVTAATRPINRQQDPETGLYLLNLES